jgi:hypothetical protein
MLKQKVIYNQIVRQNKDEKEKNGGACLYPLTGLL